MKNKNFYTEASPKKSRKLKKSLCQLLALVLSFCMLFGMVDGVLRIGSVEQEEISSDEREDLVYESIETISETYVVISDESAEETASESTAENLIEASNDILTLTTNGSLDSTEYFRVTDNAVPGTYSVGPIFTASGTGEMTLWARWRPQQQPAPRPPQSGAPRQPISILEPPLIPLIPFTNTHYRYLIGDDMNLIRPNDNITRAEVATIFFRLLTDDYREQMWTQTNPFPDVVLQNWHNNAISVMTSGGTIFGMPNGSFKPDRSITRAEFAAIISRFVEHSYDGDDLFSDISGHWAQNYINSVGSLGWVIGAGSDAYEPNRNITRAEAATIVNRILGRHPELISDLLPEMNVWPDNADQSAWYYLAIQEATNSNDYEMKDDNFHKTWIEMITDPDWAALERPNSTPQAHRNPAD